MTTVNKTDNFSNFNSQDYDLVVSFNNGEREISLNGLSIIELQIKENFIDWYTEGYIIVDNPFDHFERLPDFGDSPLRDQPELDYKYRGDGRDIITIQIMPRGDSASEDYVKQNLKPEIWEIFIEGVIYDLEELPSEDPQNKTKKFYFWDKEYHIMLVGINKNNTNIHNLSNEDRSLKTGEALLELFKSVDELKDKVPNQVSKNDQDTTGPIWSGGHDKCKILHTSPSNFKLIDDIETIIDAHSNSEDDDFDLCFLRLNRRFPNQPRKFSFEPLSSYFKKAGTTTAGEYQLDKFVLMDLHESDKTVPIIKTPPDTPSAERNIMALTRSEVHSYQFTEMSGLDSAELIQVFPVHSYNIEGGQFNIHIKDNNPEAAKEFQKNNYTIKIGPNSEPRLQLNSWKKNGYNLTNIYGYGNKENRYTLGRNKILMSCLLNGTAISFTCRGQTSRQAGRFISIVKNKYNDTDFDNRLEGQYLTMEVIHSFNIKTQDYNNQIVATKLHRYRDNGGVTPEDEDLLI
jgi:hypothetical protein